MKYYIKSAKGYWLAQGNGYTQNQSEAYAFTRPNVAVCFQSGRLHAPQTILNILKGYHYTLLCKVARSYKTITPNTPQDPQSSMGFFRSVVKPLLSVKGGAAVHFTLDT